MQRRSWNCITKRNLVYDNSEIMPCMNGKRLEDQLRKLLWDIKAVYDIAPGAAFEKVLISAEALFQENDLRTIVGEYERILEL